MTSTQLILLAAGILVVLDILLFTLLPKTKSARVVKSLRAKPATIYALITDPQNAPKWVPHCTRGEKTAGRDGPARRQALTYADGVTTEQQVTTWVADRQYGWKETPPHGPLSESRTVFTLTERGALTEVEILGEWTARSMLTKLYANFGHPAVVRRTYEAMLDSIEKLG